MLVQAMGHPVEIVKQWEDGTTEFKLSGGEIEVIIYSLGGVIQSIRAPNNRGECADVVLGYDTPQEYGKFYLGGIIGRYSNRVAEGKFTLDGQEHQLNVNHGPNHVHGGLVGFDQRPWNYSISGSKLVLTYTSPHMEENYPGTVEATVVYEVTDQSEIVIDYSATTDQPTIICLSNHAFFNLQGHEKGDIFDHKVTLSSSTHTPMDETRIPFGDVIAVDNTDLDFREGRLMTEEFLIANGNTAFRGFDQNFILPGDADSKKYVGRVEADGRIMDTYTTQPAVALYTAGLLDCAGGKGGRSYGRFSAMCIFCQNYPDAPNKPQFPSAVLRPGEKYHHTTWYKFSTEAQG